MAFRGDFNPRSPHGERLAIECNPEVHYTFQSTLPARGATGIISFTLILIALFQSTLPARGATAPRILQTVAHSAFQSTLPARGATVSKCQMLINPLISIHAPRTGSDTTTRSNASQGIYFNPRSPHGERRLLIA